MQGNQQQPHTTDKAGDFSRALIKAQAELKEGDWLPQRQRSHRPGMKPYKAPAKAQQQG